MSEGMLSQEEIDALLNSGGANNNDNIQQSSAITDYQKDTLGEIGNISMGTAATTLSMLLGRKVAITTPEVSVTTRKKIQDEYPIPTIIIEVEYTEGILGSNLFTLKQEDACVVADLMMGKEPGQDSRLDEIGMSALGEAMNQMMGSATTSLSSMFNKRIDIAPPILTPLDLGKEAIELSTDYEELVKINFKMEIEGLVNSEIMQIIPMEAVNTMINVLEHNFEEANTSIAVESSTADTVEQIVPAKPAAAPQPNPQVQANPGRQTVKADVTNNNKSFAKASVSNDSFTVQPVQFSVLHENALEDVPQNIGLILDVPLDVSVELGKTQKTIKDILDLQQGSIIQLDKMAGEPVDLLINGKLIAKGEVVVIDENYGIRITTIISPMDRMNKLQ